MTDQVYQRLARHLDDLPGGYPPTESGVELRILRRLFTPDEAQLAMHLTLLAEEPRVIARRAGLTSEEAARRLEKMATKGLIYRVQPQDKPPRYIALQMVVGIWEFHINDLDPGLVRDFEEYLPTLFDGETWQKAPQLRTIPVGESVPSQAEVLPYEQAEAIVRAQKRIAVAPCICRRERSLVGDGCDKPLESCLVFGSAADYYLKNGLARAIDLEETLAILERATDAGLVLQPANSKRPSNICCCCGCCCGVLRSLKTHPRPADLVATPFVAEANVGACGGCGQCIDRCQMDALRLEDGVVVLDAERCIGCGLCVPTCPTGALSLARKPEAAQPYVPRNLVDSTIRLGRARGKLGVLEMAGMVTRSTIDRLLARR
jgi:NAD-dependent dihydropyrimidine dehydrogenase PreA subunit